MTMTKKEAIELMNEVINKGNCLSATEEQALIILINSVDKQLDQQRTQREKTKELIAAGRIVMNAKS